MYLPTTALSFFIIPQNLYVTTLDGKRGTYSFRYITSFLRGGVMCSFSCEKGKRKGGEVVS